MFMLFIRPPREGVKLPHGFVNLAACEGLGAGDVGYVWIAASPTCLEEGQIKME